MGVDHRTTALIMLMVLMGSACAQRDGSSAAQPSARRAGEETLSEQEYLDRVDEFCGKHSYVVEEIDSTSSPKEFVETLESHFDETVTFIEALKEIDPPTAFEEDHSAFVASEEGIQEVDELLNQLPRWDAASLLAAHARRAELAKDLYYAVEFSELPESCRFQSEEFVLGVDFLTKANLSCFEFSSDIVVLFQRQARGRTEARFGPQFIHEMKQRAQQLITDLDSAVPNIDGLKKVLTMITLYAEAVEALDDVEKALAQRDVTLGATAIKEYDEATRRADRIAHDLNLTCEGVMRIDWRHVNQQHIN